MKKPSRRVLAWVLGLSLLAIPGIIFGSQIITSLITSTKTMYSGDSGEEGAEMDMPNGSTVDKEEFFRLRNEQIGLLRGLPLKDGDERIKAVRKMETQERSIAGRNTFATALADWVYLGPSPIPVTVPTSGRVTAIDVHPTNPDIAYVGTAQGGLYRTLNGGVTWTPMLDNALSLAIGSVTIAPSQPTTVYVGTGEAGLSADSFFGVGIYRITNADTSPTVSEPIGASEFTGRSISRILVHPTDPNIIFASSATGTCGTGGCAGAPAPTLGVYRSTNALATSPTFTRINSGSTTDLIMEPGVPDTIFCWVRGAAGPGGGGVYRSTNALSATPTFNQHYVSVPANSRG